MVIRASAHPLKMWEEPSKKIKYFVKQMVIQKLNKAWTTSKEEVKKKGNFS